MLNIEIKNLTPTLVEELKSEFLPIVERERERERVSLLIGNLNYQKFYNVWANCVSPFYIVNNKPVCREV